MRQTRQRTICHVYAVQNDRSLPLQRRVSLPAPDHAAGYREPRSASHDLPLGPSRPASLAFNMAPDPFLLRRLGHLVRHHAHGATAGARVPRHAGACRRPDEAGAGDRRRACDHERLEEPSRPHGEHAGDLRGDNPRGGKDWKLPAARRARQRSCNFNNNKKTRRPAIGSCAYCVPL